jgi:hypothetical protein
MKRTNSFLVIILLLAVTVESRGQRQAVNNDLIKVDVTKSYSPKKELILQDFMDVEYIALETTDDFVNQGLVRAIDKDIILVTNRIQDGNIFVYNRTGKALRKINRKGQGGEEYTYLEGGIVWDKDNGEMFVSDLGKVLVYDLYGNFKRSFKQKKDAKNSMLYADIFNYDRNHLICYDMFNEEVVFLLISKQDGSITKEIKIPVKEKKSLVRGTPYKKGKVGRFYAVYYSHIIPYNGNWIFSDISSDTMYTFSSDYSLRPFLVRTPPIQSMDTEIALIFRFFSNRYYFMETVKNEFDLNSGEGFSRTFMMYDKQEKSFSGYTVYNGDYTTKKEIYMNALRPGNHEIESWQPLEASKLVESYKKGELKGKLKEIAATLDEEDNPVIMLIKHKK